MYGFLRHIFKKMGLTETVNINTKDKFFYDLANNNGYCSYRENDLADYKEIYQCRLKYIEDLSGLPRYDVIVIDECQDFMQKELNILKKMSEKIIAVGDIGQGVYKTDSSSFFKKMPSYKLSSIYRYGKQVAALAQHFSCEEFNLSSRVTNTNKSDVYKVKSTSQQNTINNIKKIIDAKRNTSMTIGILSISNKQLKTIKSDLQKNGVNTFYCENNKDIRSYDFDTRLPILITPHSAKGMEFDCVIMIGYNGILNFGDFKSSWKEIIYVSLTRTCNELYLIEEADTKKELRELNEWKDISSSANSRSTYDEF